LALFLGLASPIVDGFVSLPFLSCRPPPIRGSGPRLWFQRVKVRTTAFLLRRFFRRFLLPWSPVLCSFFAFTFLYCSFSQFRQIRPDGRCSCSPFDGGTPIPPDSGLFSGTLLASFIRRKYRHLSSHYLTGFLSPFFQFRAPLIAPFLELPLSHAWPSPLFFFFFFAFSRGC